VNSLKTLIVVAVMGVVAYGVYATLTKAPPSSEGDEFAYGPALDGSTDAPDAKAAGFAPKFSSELAGDAGKAPDASSASNDRGIPAPPAVNQAPDGSATAADEGTDDVPEDSGYAMAEDPGLNDPHVRSAAATSDRYGPPGDFADTQSEEIPDADSQGEFPAAMTAIQQQLDQGNLADGLRALTEWYDRRGLNGVEQAQVVSLLDQLAGTVVYSRQHLLAPAHQVKPGETLEQISLLYSVPAPLLAKINGIGDPAQLKPGTELKVMQGPFDALVDVPKHRLTLFVDGCYAGRFQVGVGPEKNAPSGQFEVHDKLENPPYYAPDGQEIAADDPANPLGEYWVDLGNSLGIHGTIEPETIGGTTADGCIRLAPQDVRHVYDILSIGSRVLIRR
jgi:lipoprotein-anchoring transpeptidase ErfK/SrfK